MKNSMKVGLVMSAVAVGIVVNAWAADGGVARRGRYEYWVGHGQASAFKQQLESKLNEGFEIDRLETTSLPQGYSQSYVFAVLKREK